MSSTRSSQDSDSVIYVKRYALSSKANKSDPSDQYIDLPSTPDVFATKILEFLARNDTAIRKFELVHNDASQIGMFARIFDELNVPCPLSYNLFTQKYLEAIRKNDLVPLTCQVAHYLIDIFLDNNGKLRLTDQRLQKLLATWMKIPEADVQADIEKKLYQDNDPEKISAVANSLVSGVLIAISSQFMRIFTDKTAKLSLESLATEVRDNDYDMYVLGVDAEGVRFENTFADMPSKINFASYQAELKKISPFDLDKEEQDIHEQLTAQNMRKSQSNSSSLQKFSNKIDTALQAYPLLSAIGVDALKKYQTQLSEKIKKPSSDPERQVLENERQLFIDYCRNVYRQIDESGAKSADKRVFDKCLALILNINGKRVLLTDAMNAKLKLLAEIHSLLPEKKSMFKFFEKSNTEIITALTIKLNAIKKDVYAENFAVETTAFDTEISNRLLKFAYEGCIDQLKQITDNFFGFEGNILDVNDGYAVFNNDLTLIGKKIMENVKAQQGQISQNVMKK